MSHDLKYILLFTIFVACKTTPPHTEIEQHFKNGVVVSAHPLASQAGLAVLKKGGNAVDAAIATYMALAVVYPRAGNLGGGGFALVRDESGEIESLDFRERAPGTADRDMYLDQDGNVVPNLSLAGGLSIGVPGSVDGMRVLHQKFGSLSRSSLMEAARKIAAEGFAISKEEAGRLNGFKSDFVQWNQERIPFIKDDQWSPGDTLRQENLAKTLEQLQKQGWAAFYQEPLSEFIVQRVQEKGGIMTAEDFTDYKSVWRTPIRFDFDELEVYSMPPPSSGGITMAQILMALEPLQLENAHSVEDIHAIAEAERRAFADRSVHLGDPDFVDIPKDTLLSKTYIAKKWEDFNPQRASKSEQIKEGQFDWSRESFETTHLTVADAKGMVVSITTTLNSNFGSKVFVPELGFFLNNEMDDFSAKPGVPNQFGLLGNEANAIEPGKRMLSSMTPTIIEKNGKFYMALGSPGGSTIITTVAQVILNIERYGMNLTEAVAHPRFHHQWWPDVIMMEKSFDPQTKKSLENMGHQTKSLDRIGLVEAVLHDNKGFIGVSDPRGEGAASGF